MKEIALLGTNGHVMGNVLGALLARGLGVNAMVDFPEKVMLADSRLTVTHFNPADRGKTEASLQGYTEAVLTYNDDLEDKYTNELTLKYFVDTVLAARRVGVERVIVVGGAGVRGILPVRIAPPRQHRLGIHQYRRRLRRAYSPRNRGTNFPQGAILRTLAHSLSLPRAGISATGWNPRLFHIHPIR